MKNLSNYQIIKRTIQALKYCYPLQSIDKETVFKCINNNDFLTKYVNY